MLVWAQVMAYRTDAFKGAAPKDWADFWNTKKFPGDRAMGGTGAGGWPEIEFALMAAGVPAAKLYPLDIDKAFASYDEIKKAVVKWWDTGAVPIQLLTDREVAMTTVWNGRIAALQAAGVPAAISWDQGLMKRDAWGIVNGAINAMTQRYDRASAVSGFSLTLDSGEFLTLLGPSGSGKTTTLMMIAGFETPTRGDIAIDGKSVVAMLPYRRNIGMVFQNSALFPHLTAADNIGFPLKQRGVGKAEREKLVREALALMQLPDHGERYPRQLSGGQQQRAALTRATVFYPRLLLMVEPLGALDKQLRENLQLDIRRLHPDLGITFIYLTHAH